MSPWQNNPSSRFTHKLHKSTQAYDGISSYIALTFTANMQQDSFRPILLEDDKYLQVQHSNLIKVNLYVYVTNKYEAMNSLIVTFYGKNYVNEMSMVHRLCWKTYTYTSMQNIEVGWVFCFSIICMQIGVDRMVIMFKYIWQTSITPTVHLHWKVFMFILHTITSKDKGFAKQYFNSRPVSKNMPL